MADINTILSHLDGLTQDDWRAYHSDSEVQNIAIETAALLKRQEDRIRFLTRAIEQMPKPTKLLDVFGNGYAKIVRCEDCRYWLPMNRFDPDYHPGRGECELNCWVRDYDWFCGDGKRREQSELEKRREQSELER